MIGWMVRNSISRKANVLKIHKTQIRPNIEYFIQAWASVLRQKFLFCVLFVWFGGGDEDLYQTNDFLSLGKQITPGFELHSYVVKSSLTEIVIC